MKATHLVFIGFAVIAIVWAADLRTDAAGRLMMSSDGGRYQLSKPVGRFFIVDTATGHLWYYDIDMRATTGPPVAVTVYDLGTNESPRCEMRAAELAPAR